MHGFTLIELLVVVAIIGLLVSILIPAFIGVREKARLVVCQSNLHNITTAWYAYLQDNRDRLPRGLLVHTTFGGKQGQAPGYGGPVTSPPPTPSPLERASDYWRPLNRYLGLPLIVGKYPPGWITTPGEAPPVRVTQMVEVFRCPGDTGSYIRTNSAPVYSSHFDYYGNSYHTNRFVIGPTPPRSTWSDPCRSLIDEIISRFDNFSINASAATNQNRLIFLGDYDCDNWQNPAQNSPPLEFHARAYRGSSPMAYDPKAESRHCVAFMDGHTEFVGIRKGIYVSSAYTVIPFRDMQQAFAVDQTPGN